MQVREHWYLISYDIRDPKRLARLHRYLKRHSFMLQESVYLYAGNNQAWQLLSKAIQKCINKQQDDVKVYQLDKDCCLHFFGSSPWPQDVYFGGYPQFTLTPCPASAQAIKT
jgi:CRISPR-associated protein Cas2